MKIDSVITKHDEKLEFDKLTVLVGPNNSGKSRTLMDIKDIFQSGFETKRVLIKTIHFADISFNEFKKGFAIIPDPSRDGRHLLSSLGPEVRGGSAPSINLEELEKHVSLLNEGNWNVIARQGIGSGKVTYLNAQLRLTTAQKSDAKYDNFPQLPLQAWYEKYWAHSELEDAFKDAFDKEIKFDSTHTGILNFRVADKFDEIPKDNMKAKPVFEKYETLDDQGDGFKSFVGVALGIILSEGRVILLDEPEAFLHPTQARVLGEWIGNYSKSYGTQIILATHSADILEGILSSKQKPSIFRLNRTNDKTVYNQISSKITSQLASMPLVSSQPIQESIFYRSVIVCEGDKDRVVYKGVYSQEFDKREHLFVGAFGKHAIKKIIEPLRAANIPVCAVTDIDILNSETVFKELIESLRPSEDFSAFLQIRRNVAKSVEGMDETQVFENIKVEVQKLSENLKNNTVNLTEVRRSLVRIHEGSSKWKIIKKNGLDEIPKDVRGDAKTLLKDLKEIGLFVVPVGELESWIPLENVVWIEKALELIQNDKIPESLQSFVKEVIDYLENAKFES